MVSPSKTFEGFPFYIPNVIACISVNISLRRLELTVSEQGGDLAERQSRPVADTADRVPNIVQPHVMKPDSLAYCPPLIVHGWTIVDALTVTYLLQ